MTASLSHCHHVITLLSVGWADWLSSLPVSLAAPTFELYWSAESNLQNVTVWNSLFYLCFKLLGQHICIAWFGKFFYYYKYHILFKIGDSEGTLNNPPVIFIASLEYSVATDLYIGSFKMFRSSTYLVRRAKVLWLTFWKLKRHLILMTVSNRLRILKMYLKK